MALACGGMQCEISLLSWKIVLFEGEFTTTNDHSPMRYYLRINDEESGPYRIDDMQRALADGQITLNTMTRAEDEQVWKPLGPVLAAAEAPAASHFPPPPAPPKQQQSIHSEFKLKNVRTHLVFIRAYTNYPVLRSMIHILYWLGMVALGFTALVQLRIFGRPLGLNLLAYLLIFGSTIVSGLVLHLIRLLLLMFVDITDTLLHDHARNRNRD
jgi:GYF domain 2